MEEYKINSLNKNTSGDYMLYYKRKIQNNHLSISYNFHHNKGNNHSDFFFINNSFIRSEKNDSKRYSQSFKANYFHKFSSKFQINAGSNVYHQYFKNNFVGNITYKYQNLRINYFIDLNFSISKIQTRITNKAENYFTYLNSSLLQNQFNWYPAINAFLKINNHHSFRFNLSSMSRYPSVWMLVPYETASADSLTIYKGNPNLKPQKFYNFNLRHSYSRNKFYLQSSAFYRYSKDIIKNTTHIEENKQVNIPQNLLYLNTFGLNLYSRIKLLNENMSISLSFSPHYNIYSHTLNKGWSYNLESVVNIELPGEFSFETDFSISNKEIGPEGYSKHDPSLNLLLLKSFHKQNLQLAVGYRNLFYNKSTTVTDIRNYYQHTTAYPAFNGVFFRISYFFKKGENKEKENSPVLNTDGDIKN